MRVIVLYTDSGDWNDIKVFKDVQAVEEYCRHHTSWDVTSDEFQIALDHLRHGEDFSDAESVLFWRDVEAGAH